MLRCSLSYAKVRQNIYRKEELRKGCMKWLPAFAKLAVLVATTISSIIINFFIVFYCFLMVLSY